jgi:Kdo2-lipid IVA lauroyltransferase/acyltransferase
LAWWAKDKVLDKLVTEVKGFEHIENARKQDQGIQILFAHYGTLELGGRWIGDRIPLYATSKRYHNPLSHYMIIKHRLQHLKAVLMPNDFKKTVKLLKQKSAIAFMLDLDFGLSNTVMSTFMGMPCATTTTSAKLAKKLNTLVIPMRCYRLPHNKGYGIAFDAPLENYGALDDASAARLFNELIEIQVKQYPEQYYWLHQRFKTQADGLSPYRKKV